jgi:hypothetical protein
MRCPFCAAPNHTGVSFCIECGEPLDAASLAGVARGLPPVNAPATRVRRARATLRIPRIWELALGLALLLAVLGTDAVSTAQQNRRDSQAAALRRGMAAVDAHHWLEAREALRAASDYGDALRRLQTVEATIDRIRTLYNAAETAAAAGAWSAATLDYQAVATLQPDYEQVGARLETARAAAGSVLYRTTAAGQPSLWWVAVDGSNPRPMPDSDAMSYLNGSSPDGRWTIYSTFDPTKGRRGLRTPWLLDLRSGDRYALRLDPTLLPGGVTAEFRADGSGFWAQFDDQLFYADLTTVDARGVVLQPCAADVVARDALSGVTIRLSIGHALPPVPVPPPPTRPAGVPISWLRVAGKLGEAPQELARETGTVSNVSLSAGGRFVTYKVTQAADNGRAITDTWVLLDRQTVQPAPGNAQAPRRQVIASAPSLRDGWPLPQVRVSALPGADSTHLRLLVYPPAGLPWIYDAVTGRQWTVDPPDLGDETWHLSHSSLVASPAGRWLGLELWTPIGQGILSRMAVRPLDGGPDWTMLVPADLPTWIGFSSDEQYAFYSVSTNELRAERRTRLYSVPAPDGAGGPRVSAVTPLLEHLVPAPGWLRDIALSRDGRRVLALLTPDQIQARPPAGATPHGLYALRPDGTDWLLIAPGAVEFWVPGGPPWAVAGTP